MPIYAGWLLKNRITYFDYVGDVLIEELESAIEISLTMLEQHEGALLHSVQTYDSMMSFPQNAAKLVTATQALMNRSDVSWIIFVGIQTRSSRR